MLFSPPEEERKPNQDHSPRYPPNKSQKPIKGQSKANQKRLIGPCCVENSVTIIRSHGSIFVPYILYIAYRQVFYTMACWLRQGAGGAPH